jgi:hypothetical protein
MVILQYRMHYRIIDNRIVTFWRSLSWIDFPLQVRFCLFLLSTLAFLLQSCCSFLVPIMF